jgi:phosphoglycolate phosphatase-like HAD superfamily hydrolase
LGISQYFISINGSPTPKKSLVRDVIEKYHYEHAETVLIGDSINDYDAAQENTIEFYGYNANELAKNGFNYINSFKIDFLL